MLRRLLPIMLSLAAVAGWAVAGALLQGRSVGDAAPYVVAVGAMAAGVLVGWLTGRWVRWTAPVVVVGFLVLEYYRGDLSGGPTSGLLGYANAEAALAVQMGALTLVGGAAVRRRWSWLWWLLAAAAMSVTVLVKSAAGVGLAGLVLVVAVYALLARSPHARWAPLVGAVGILGAGAAQVALTAAQRWPQQAISALSDRRIDLWSDAWDILLTSPWTGQGPGSFAELSPTAADPDTRAAHSVLMQVLAELGMVGALLLVAVAVAGLALLRGAPARFVLVGVVAWVALWLHGVVDYVMQFPPVLVAGGVVLGAGVRAGLTAASRAAAAV